ncbi:MAG: hypothetical protein KBH14_04580 [Vicinamibacteria bacterium]|nr:hypothetical protein [Vicinamibacteria bacterium]
MMGSERPKGPSTLTPASIELIERDASARYGYPVKIVLPPQEAPQEAIKPTNSASSKPKAKAPEKAPEKKSKVPKPVTEGTVLELIRKAGDKGVSGAEVIALWPTKMGPSGFGVAPKLAEETSSQA